MALRIVQGDRVAPRVHSFFHSVVSDNGVLLSCHLTQQEAELLVAIVGRGELGKMHKLPPADVNLLSWEGALTGIASRWTTDSKIVFIRSSVRDSSVSRRLAHKMGQTVCDPKPENPVSDKTIGDMVAEEGARATARAKVLGMIHSHYGPVAIVEAEGGVRARLDARRLSLIGNVVHGSLYINASDPYTPVAFKRGEVTVGLIMPLRYDEPTGEEAIKL